MKHDLSQPPENDELRVFKGDNFISIWLPAEMGVVGQVLTALSDMGFDIVRHPEKP